LQIINNENINCRSKIRKLLRRHHSKKKMEIQLNINSNTKSVKHIAFPFLLVLTLIFISRGAIAQTAYISNSTDNTISVIDVTTNTVTDTIPMSGFGHGIAVSPDGSKVFVTHPFSGFVSVITTATNTVSATIPLFTDSRGVCVSPDGSKAYVALYNENKVIVINTSTNTISDTIAVGNSPSGICVSPDGSKVYVANTNSYSVSVINTATNTVSNTILIPCVCYPYFISMSPDGLSVFVTHGQGGTGNNTISVINTVADTILATIAVDSVNSFPSSVCLAPDGSKVYVGNKLGRVSIIETATLTVIDTLSVCSDVIRGVSLSPDGSKLYVVAYYDNAVIVINTATNTVSDTIEVGNFPVAFGGFISKDPLVGIASPGNEPESITVYPNPTASNITIEFSTKSKNAEIRLLNVLGKELLNQNISTDKNTIIKQLDLSHYSNGFYFLSIRTEKENYVQRIVKQD
jgi:YVTN family beta-propeller protein